VALESLVGQRCLLLVWPWPKAALVALSKSLEVLVGMVCQAPVEVSQYWVAPALVELEALCIWSAGTVLRLVVRLPWELPTMMSAWDLEVLRSRLALQLLAFQGSFSCPLAPQYLDQPEGLSLLWELQGASLVLPVAVAWWLLAPVWVLEPQVVARCPCVQGTAQLRVQEGLL